ncbi:hypothetical protein C8Q77DRAFT_1130424 [Trametes polyzona]|nr:hypothetical protein C8Q77DRAFT_1130424 [Trametes polyzona]
MHGAGGGWHRGPPAVRGWRLAAQSRPGPTPCTSRGTSDPHSRATSRKNPRTSARKEPELGGVIPGSDSVEYRIERKHETANGLQVSPQRPGPRAQSRLVDGGSLLTAEARIDAKEVPSPPRPRA